MSRKYTRIHGNVSREMETPKKNQKGMLEIKNIITGIKNAFDRLKTDWMRPRKQSVSLKNVNRKFQN